LIGKATEGVGFEPTVTQDATLVFKTSALNRSAILPNKFLITSAIFEQYIMLISAGQ
jgi:hypothetical protein